MSVPNRVEIRVCGQPVIGFFNSLPLPLIALAETEERPVLHLRTGRWVEVLLMLLFPPILG